MPKMIKTELEDRVYGHAAFATCPICGASVRLGGYVNIDEAPEFMPGDELVEICIREVVHTKAQEESHQKAKEAWELASIPVSDYIAECAIWPSDTAQNLQYCLNCIDRFECHRAKPKATQ